VTIYTHLNRCGCYGLCRGGHDNRGKAIEGRSEEFDKRGGGRVEDEDEDRESEIGLEQINCCRDSHFEWMLWMLKYEMKDMMSRVVILAVPCSCCSFTFFCVFFCTALMIFFRVRVRPSAPPHPDSHVTRILPTWQCTHTYYTPAQPILFTFCATNWTIPVRNMAIAYDRESRCGLHFFFLS
jgi:hypothetical protein